MPGFPSSGGGYQIGDGNTAEVYMGVQSAPAATTGTTTLTVAQVTGGLILANPSSTAATYTTPTGTQLDTALPNAKNDSTFETTIINLGTGAGDITLSAGSGVTLSGATVINDGTAGRLLWRRTADNTWTAYRVV